MIMKRKFIDALDLKNNTNSIPVWELEFHLWNKFGLGDFVVGIEFEKLSNSKKDYTLHQNVESICKVSQLLSFSAITVPGGYWEVSPGVPAYYYLPGDYRLKQIELLKENIGNDVALVACTGGVMAMPEGHDYVDFSIKMMTDPDEIDIIAENTFHNSKQLIKDCADLGVDVILTASDIADGHGLYFSPEQLDRYIYPFLEKWNTYVKALGLKSIMHTDGNINDAISRLANSGINGIQALDSTANMDIISIQKLYCDKLCVCGNVDCGLMLTGTPDSVYEATRKLVIAMEGAPNFVLGASNALQYSTPIENYKAMIAASKIV